MATLRNYRIEDSIQMVMQHDNIEYEEAKRRASVPLKRGTLFERALEVYGYKCYFCPSLASGVDHLIPLARTLPGVIGRNGLANVRPACQLCNQIKGVLTEEEYWRALEIAKSRYPNAVRLTVRHFKEIPEVAEIRHKAMMDMNKIRAQKNGFSDSHLYFKNRELA